MNKQLIIAIILLAGMVGLKANNLTISNTSYDNGTSRVSFDVSWENSWRTSITQPYNYDGVWIFVKVRECTEKNLGNPAGFTHAWLSTNPGDHTATNSNPGGEALTIEVGTTNIGGNDRGMGIFIYQTLDVTESKNISTTVTLQWDKATQAGEMAAIDAADDYDVQVFGMEMVYVPQGAFYLGDGSSSNCFEDGSGNPFQVTSENAFGVSGTLNRTIDPAGSNVNANFPKGYDAFWIMKYEITQYQYAEFLNTLTPDQAQQRTDADLFTLTSRRYVMSDQNDIDHRQAIVLDPEGDRRTDKFYVNLDNDNNYNEAEDGLGIACNYLNLRDVFAYLDWAALRPLTEMEYEKACRGATYPQSGEYAWGSVGITEIQGIVNSGQSNERAIASGVGLCNYGSGGAGSSGPMRVGYAATSTTNRAEAGCSYYGVMDLTGNVFEPYISIYNTVNITTTFTNAAGNGELDSEGYHDAPSWPSRSGNADYGIALPNGGTWAYNQNYGTVSRRDEEHFYNDYTFVVSRSNVIGGRGGR
jgi:formylglycine-generating enzyme required for sulfatase activity